MQYTKVPSAEETVTSYVPHRQTTTTMDTGAPPPKYPSEMLYVIVVVESPSSSREVAAHVCSRTVREFVDNIGGRRLTHKIVAGTRSEVLVALQGPPPDGFATSLLASLRSRYESIAPITRLPDDVAIRAGMLAAEIMDMLCVAIATGYCSRSAFLTCYLVPLSEAVHSSDAQFAARCQGYLSFRQDTLSKSVSMSSSELIK